MANAFGVRFGAHTFSFGFGPRDKWRPPTGVSKPYVLPDTGPHAEDIIVNGGADHYNGTLEARNITINGEIKDSWTTLKSKSVTLDFVNRHSTIYVLMADNVVIHETSDGSNVSIRAKNVDMTKIVHWGDHSRWAAASR
jgi:hypothetical protein